MQRRLKVAIIGAGYWGPNLIRNYSNCQATEAAVVCDLDADRLQKVCSKFPGLRGETDYGKVLSCKDIDAVAIATPVSSHFRLAKAAIEAGKHVMVEKPMTATVAEAEELVALARSAGVTLMVDHTFAYTSAVRRIREMVVDGSLGDLLYYDSVRINLGLFQHDVNVLWDLAVHDLAIMDFALGVTPVAVSATGLAHLGPHEDVAYLTCFFESNLIAHFHLNWLSPLKLRRTIIGGSKKMVVFDDLEPSEKLKVYDRGATVSEPSPESLQKIIVDYRMGDMWAPHLDQGEALASEVGHFAECIRDGRQPDTNGESGLRVVRILEAASKSLKNQGTLVKLT